jgi:hypothetical protein
MEWIIFRWLLKTNRCGLDLTGSESSSSSSNIFEHLFVQSAKTVSFGKLKLCAFHEKKYFVLKRRLSSFILTPRTVSSPWNVAVLNET